MSDIASGVAVSTASRDMYWESGEQTMDAYMELVQSSLCETHLPMFAYNEKSVVSIFKWKEPIYVGNRPI